MVQPLSLLEQERYSRQMILPGFGLEAQQKLKAAKVLVVGAGGLGCPVLQYLVAAGVGTISIVEDDAVSLSNLHRQVIYTQSDIGSSKAKASAIHLHENNDSVALLTIEARLTSSNALDIIAGYDVIVDATDNFPSRYLINDACVLHQKVLVYGSVHQFEGQVAVFNALQLDGTRSANYRDLYPTPPAAGSVPDCAEGGVLGVLPGIVGSMQALEVIKLIAEIGEPLIGRLLIYDALSATTRTIAYKSKNTSQKITHLIDYEMFCGVKPPSAPTSTMSYLDYLKFKTKPHVLIDVRENAEHEAQNIGGINIPLGEIENNGIDFPKEAKVVLYCKSGKRGERAVQVLTSHWGFTNVYNLTGGIDAALAIQASGSSKN